MTDEFASPTTRPNALRGVALGRKAWLFAGSDRGGERAAAIYCLAATAKLNDVDPRAWLADVLGRIADHPVTRLHELPPWNWSTLKQVAMAGAACTPPRRSPDGYEQTIDKLKRIECVAMRCEKTDISYSAIISFASGLKLVKSTHPA